jgi:two-component system LytT family response regulator
VTLRAIVVDDEPLARARLGRLLAGQVRVVAECGDGKSAIVATRVHQPDLLFLDVQMPELDGFGVLAALGPDAVPAIVFVTAYDRYAVRAFDTHAVDYLLKPFDADRLERAVARARGRAQARGDADRLRALLAGLVEPPAHRAGSAAPPARLAVNDGERTVMIDVDAIDFLEAEGNYVAIHAGGRVHLLRDTLATMAARLDPRRFLRIHRSRIVRIDRVRAVEPLFHGELRLTLSSGVHVTSSRRYRDDIRAALGIGRGLP